MYKYRQNSLYNSSPNKGKSHLSFFFLSNCKHTGPQGFTSHEKSDSNTANKIKTKTNAHVIKLK